MKTIILSCFCLMSVMLSAQVNLTQSNLPIVVINTFGANILDEPKISADMKIIWKGNGQINNVSDNTYNYNGKIGIELRGSTSQSLSAKKPYALELKDALGNDMDAALLGLPKENDWSLLAPYSDKTLIREAITYTLAGSFMAWSPRVRFCELILNNAYQGVYVLTEKIKRGKNRVNIGKENLTATSGDSLTGGYILKIDKTTGEQISGIPLSFKSNYVNGRTHKTDYLYHYPKPEDITTAQKTYIKALVNEFETVLYGNNATHPTLGYAKYFDVTTLIDFLIINEITRNVDGYRLSAYLYKDRNSVDSKFKMGPVWDFNITLGNADYCQGNLTTGWAFDFNTVCAGDSWQIPFWWKPIVNDAEFKRKWRNRWTKLRTQELSNTRIFGMIDSMTTLLNAAQGRNFQRWPILNQKLWPNPQVNNSYSGEIAYLKTWMQQRLAWMDSQINTFPPTSTQETLPQARVFPNPSVSSVQFDYTLLESGKVKLLILNNIGQNVFHYTTDQQAGNNHMQWSGEAAHGLYFYEIYVNGTRTFAGRLTIL